MVVGRSIPACTGKPTWCGATVLSDEVYPRMYGETDRCIQPRALGSGLSPHVRGNLGQVPVDKRCEGSIPACTGKPRRARSDGSLPGVYPRMYGETVLRLACYSSPKGLSPHVRGNLKCLG